MLQPKQRGWTFSAVSQLCQILKYKCLMFSDQSFQTPRKVVNDQLNNAIMFTNYPFKVQTYVSGFIISILFNKNASGSSSLALKRCQSNILPMIDSGTQLWSKKNHEAIGPCYLDEHLNNWHSTLERRNPRTSNRETT